MRDAIVSDQYQISSQKPKKQMDKQMELQINGKAMTADIDPTMPLLWALRDVFNLTGTKYSCGVAACGACTVRVDGLAVRSCVTPVSTASLDCGASAAVWLLPKRDADGGGGVVGENAETD
jgi:succinate dehydrogenase/fumarate reductase-like Fe-S protein